MLPTIFQPEISELETQLNAIATRINDLRQAETKLEAATASLSELISTIEPLGKIEDVKRLILDLFKGSSPHGGGNDDGTGDAVAVEVEPETLPILEAIEQQTLAPVEILTRKINGEYTELVKASDAVAYFRKHDGQILATYAGSNNKARLNTWGQFLAIRHTFGCGFEVRQAKRLAEFGFKHELKLIGANIDSINWLASQDLSKSPPSEGIEQYRRPVPPAYTKPTHSLRINSETVYAGTEEECRRRFEQAIADSNTRFPKLLNSNYEVLVEFDRDKLEATPKQPTSQSIGDFLKSEVKKQTATIPLLEPLPEKPSPVLSEENPAMEQPQEQEQKPLSSTFKTNDCVKVTPTTAGGQFEELAGEIGYVVTSSPAGVVVDIKGRELLQIPAAELRLVVDDLFQATPEPSKYTFTVKEVDNIFEQFNVYESDRFVGIVARVMASGHWKHKGSNQTSFSTREAAAAALDAKQKADKATHQRMNAAMLERFQEAS